MLWETRLSLIYPYSWPHPQVIMQGILGFSSFAIQHSFVYSMVDAIKVVLFGMLSMLEDDVCGAVCGLRAVQRTENKSGTLT